MAGSRGAPMAQQKTPRPSRWMGSGVGPEIHERSGVDRESCSSLRRCEPGQVQRVQSQPRGRRCRSRDAPGKRYVKLCHPYRRWISLFQECLRPLLGNIHSLLLLFGSRTSPSTIDRRKGESKRPGEPLSHREIPRIRAEVWSGHYVCSLIAQVRKCTSSNGERPSLCVADRWRATSAEPMWASPCLVAADCVVEKTLVWNGRAFTDQ